MVISIDLELAWGNWDILTPEDLEMAAKWERPICGRLLKLFDRYETPVTWAIVAALLDEDSATSRPGGLSCWYAPDIIDSIVRAKAGHEVASHGGRHVYFSDVDPLHAAHDLSFARDVHHAHSLPFDSFVFPRNLVGQLDTVGNAGLKVFRGPERGWVETTRGVMSVAGRAAHLVDRVLPLPPRAVVATRGSDLVDVPASMLFLGRNGLRRMVSPRTTRAKLSAGLERAQRAGEIFHLWFHPSNFYHRLEEQFSTLTWFLESAALQASRGLLDIRTMGSYAAMD